MGNDTTAKRIADRVTIAHLGRPPTDSDDPAHDEWWALHSDVARAAEDEIGRAKLLQAGRVKDVADVWKRLTALGPLDAVTIAQAAAFDQLGTAIGRVGAGG